MHIILFSLFVRCQPLLSNGVGKIGHIIAYTGEYEGIRVPRSWCKRTPLAAESNANVGSYLPPP